MSTGNNLRPPNILMFVPQYPYPVVGGLERQSHELSKALIQKKIKVKVISGKIAGEGPSHEYVENVEVTRLPWSDNKFFRSILGTLYLALYMARMRKEYDIVHIHNISWAGGIVVLLAKLLGKRTLVKLPNVGEYGIPCIKSNRLGNLLMDIFKKSDAMIALSNESAEEILGTGYPAQKILKITNGVSLSNFFEQTATAHQSNDIRILFSGRLTTQKGIPDLLAAWQSILAKTDRPIHLDICGEGPLADEIGQTIRDLGIDNTVTLHGHVQDIRAMLASADIFVLPSYFEGNSNAILEAMSSGLPIVSTSVGGTLTMVGPRAAKLICQPGDRDALAANLLSLISDAEKRRGYGAEMRQRAIDHFDIHSISERYLNTYTHLQRPAKDKFVGNFSSPIFEEKF